MTQNSRPGAHGRGGDGAPQWGGWPAAAPRPGVIPLRPLTLGDIVSGCFATLRGHGKTLVGVLLAVQGIVLTVMAVAAGITVATVHAHIEPVFDAPYGEAPASEHVVPLVVAAAVLFVLLFVIGMLGVSVIAAVCPAVLREAVTGRPTTFRAMWRASVRRAPAVAGALFLSALIAGSPVFLALAVWGALVASVDSHGSAFALLGVLPLLMLAAAPLSVWLSTRYSLASAVVVLEDAHPVTGLRRSVALVRGDWWRIFGITILAGLLAGAIAYVIQLPFHLIGTFALMPAAAAMPYGDDASAGVVVALVFALFLILVAGAAGQAFQIGFTQLASALLYVDQRIRREGLAEALLTDLATAAATAAPGAATPRPPS
ncbi:hypothetical protein [Streptomyces sp. RerS4]|uniref:hypothetical protein n=1 Tax=Streptomyces sp. RerS4 TaxID=2942449 RepID=UPI00201BB0C0|nr:hypothetical protein [Streptomyces sp. RerS4]UQW99394.1 hypothetical protein M4D82_01765 [Streptomyces sp. RerS4]